MAWVSPEALRLFLCLVGVIQLLLLIQLAPHLRRLFTSERYGGYADSRPATLILQSPPVLVGGAVAWLAACLLLIAGQLQLISAAALFLITQYIFVRQRYRSISRGCGAPGFVSYWLALTSLLLVAAGHIGVLSVNLAATVMVVDFALIFLAAGLYKAASGYRHGYGIYIGMVNPQWSYAPRFWARNPRLQGPFRLLDTYGWGGEIIGAVLILIPQTRSLGALLIASMFVGLVPLVRLGTLTFAVLIQCSFVILVATDPVAVVIRQALRIPNEPALSMFPVSELATAFNLGILVLGLAMVGGYLYLMTSFYVGVAFPSLVARTLEQVNTAFGQILWRVFTADVTGFYVEIAAVSKSSGTVRSLARWDGFAMGRFQEVTEAIVVTSIFTARRYYPHNLVIFGERLTRYAHTLPVTPQLELIIFEYMQIDVHPDEVVYANPVSFLLDLEIGSLCVVDGGEDPSIHPAPHSVVRPAVRPGSYRRSQV